MPAVVEPAVARHLFELGFAGGVSVLAASAYCAVSPRWLRGLLLACAALVIARYATLAALATATGLGGLAPWHRLYLGSAIGLTFPGVVALDQLIRHPAMTPKKLVTWYAPFCAIYAFIMLCGPLAITGDIVSGVQPHLAGWAAVMLGATQSAFVLGFLWLAWQAARRFPIATTRRAIFGLMAAYLCLGIEGVLVAIGDRPTHRFVVTEIVASLAIWFALDTARHASI